MNHTSISEAISQISKFIPEDRVLLNEPMSQHTSFRIGGSAAALVIVNTEGELSKVLGAISTAGCGKDDFLILGNGTNLLVSDGGYSGIVVTMGRGEDSDFGRIGLLDSSDDDSTYLVRVGASRLLSGVSNYLMEKGLAGFEFASGIPGSIGGAVYMNAGAYGGEMKDVVRSVRVLDKDAMNVFELPAEEMDFGYRHSLAEDRELIILSTVLELAKGDPQEIEAKITELREKRNSKQPVEYPSAGSTFKRPIGGYAAALIDEAGLKGYRVGGAMLSEKHAGFVINAGNATCEDVLAVMRHVRDCVFEKSGIMLEPEVKLVGCEL